MVQDTSKNEEAHMSILERVGRFAESARVQNIIAVLIVVNAITFGLQTVPGIMASYEPILTAVDTVILWVFVTEIVAKMAWQRFRFFKNGWNLFDFAVVAIALVPATGQVSVLRALRILRALRLVSVIPQMRQVVGALFTAIPGILSVGSIILLLFYVSAVLTTNFFGELFPDWFGNIGASMYTLFQIMTLESWSMGIVRPVMEQYPLAWLFFIPFILVNSFAILNLFIGIIVDAMQTQHELRKEHMHQGCSTLIT